MALHECATSDLPCASFREVAIATLHESAATVSIFSIAQTIYHSVKKSAVRFSISAASLPGILFVQESDAQLTDIKNRTANPKYCNGGVRRAFETIGHMKSAPTHAGLVHLLG